MIIAIRKPGYDDEFSKYDLILTVESQYFHQSGAFRFAIMSIFENEKHLDAGRFINFSKSRLMYSIEILSIIIIGDYPMYNDFINHDDYIDLKNKIEWIAENIHYKWSLGFVYKFNSRLSNIFSFENEIDATYFAMRWI